MAPTSSEKPKGFSFTLSEKEHQMLLQMANDENRSAANWIRSVIQRLYNERALSRHTVATGQLLGTTKRKSQRSK
jgi:hypothetical protein